MEKIKLILIMLVCALLIGCAAQEETPDKTTDTSGPDVKVYEQASDDDGEVAKPASSDYPALSSEIKALFAKADKVESMEYDYQKFVPGTVKSALKVYVKGDRMKIDLQLSTGTYIAETRYDTAYLDTAAKTVEAYCEDHKRCENTTKQIPANYNDFVRETPLTFLDTIDHGEITGTVTFDNKECTLIEYDEGANHYKVWIWEYRGLPLKYEVTDADEETVFNVDFNDLAVNHLKDRDLLP